MRKIITAMLITLSLAASASAADTHDADKATILGCDSDCATGILY
ncbi:MAG: hypothetical protein OQK48_09480 [Sulfurimonas sp.]|nr:hypothetical protein [Sulfurimonas sp.]MCW8894511.1 hypothetical protein [Sulfurimonas sp.]MCW8955157.1 hypothetical protein [Sulfurimonas sp.]MCW9067772.1 hypothetical protein [Sulfurimonas sp.]